MKKLETQFHEALLSQLSQAEQATGVAEPRLLGEAERLGGAEAVRRMLKKGQTTRQFSALKEKKRLELSVEALVIQGRYGSLFSDEEVNLCLSALLEAGMF